MLLYEFHPLAERELVNAVEHYEALAPGKGLELAQQVQAAIQRVCEFPDSAPITRRAICSLVVPILPILLGKGFLKSSAYAASLSSLSKTMALAEQELQRCAEIASRPTRSLTE